MGLGDVFFVRANTTITLVNTQPDRDLVIYHAFVEVN